MKPILRKTTPDAILLASDLSQAGVTGSLTSINLAGNFLGVQGAKALVEGGAFMGSMTRLVVRANQNLGKEGRAALRKAIEGRSGFELLL